MKNIINILVLILLLASCVSQKSYIRKNFKKTDKLSEELFRSNGNSFVITSIYSDYSNIWSYTKNKKITINLSRGKIQKVDTVASNFYNKYLIEAQKTFKGISPINCPELDGDLFLIRMNYNAKDEVINYNSVNIKCLFDVKNDNNFIRALAKDVDFLNKFWLRN